jgi:hypothetical protein
MELIISILAVLISTISLFSALRKKEFGEFALVQKDGFISEIWIRVIKSNVYEVEFVFLDEKKASRIKLLNPSDGKDSPLWFNNSTYDNFKIPVAFDNSIFKITNHSGLKIKIKYKDRYNNWYSQQLKYDSISKRKHLNPLNLIFGGN